MRLLKPSKSCIQIVLMRWISQAFKLWPKTCFRLIIIKKQYNIQHIFSKNEKKTSKNYSKVMYGHSKWSPHNFELDFGSIQIILFDQRFAKALFLKSFEVCSFWNINFLFFLTYPNVKHIMAWNQAYLLSSKRCKTKFWYMERPCMGCKLYLKDIFKEYKTNCPFRFQ